MKFKLLLIFLTFSFFSYSQCFDCAKNYGGWVDDETRDIHKAVDGMIYMVETGWLSTINKYDFDCNLVWSIEINSMYTDLRSITSDELGNLYLIIDYTISPNAGMGPWDEDGFIVSPGMNVYKLSPDGAILWHQHIGVGVGGGITNINYRQNEYTITGTYYTDITFPNGLSFSFPYSNYRRAFIAKYDSDGNFIDAITYGDGQVDFTASEFDTEGNIYLTSFEYTGDYSTLTKYTNSLQLSWSTELSSSNSNDTSIYRPNGLRYNSENNKVYIWGAINQTTTILGNVFFVSSSNGLFQNVLTEFDATDGTLTNFKRYDNNSTLNIGMVLGYRTAYMAEKDNYLYVFTSFRDSLEFTNSSITSTPNTVEIIAGPNIPYQEELILFRVNLSDFSDEFVTKSYGVSDLDYALYERAGPIIFNDEDLYLTATFKSNPMYINGTIIHNNSGNNDQDAMYFKFNINNIGGGVSFSDTCLSYPTAFNLSSNFDSVSWDFDDPDSGDLNTSTEVNPTHVFTSVGTYNVATTVTCGNETETKITSVTITDIPIANQIDDVYGCEDLLGSQISSSFDTSEIADNLLDGQTNIIISYFDNDGNELPSPLPNPMTNTVEGTQTITARLAKATNPDCYVETTFNLVTTPLPEPLDTFSIYACDEDNDGFTTFDLSNIEATVLTDTDDFNIVLIDSNGNLIDDTMLANYNNLVVDEVITIRYINNETQCYSETPVYLLAKPVPTANDIEVIGCDEDGDGIANFSLTEIEEGVLGEQTGLEVSFYDDSGNPFPTPIPLPYRNTEPYLQTIIVRVTDTDTGCYDEALVTLVVSTKPSIHRPQDLITCDDGNGIGVFDTSGIKEEIIGTQTGLTISYFDAEGNTLPSPLPSNFSNTQPYNQTIYVEVTNNEYPQCSSQTYFNLVVHNRPDISLQNEYEICELEPSLYLSVMAGYDSYEWLKEDGLVVSTNYNATLTEAGSYTLTVGNTQNGFTCYSSFEFNLIRHSALSIAEVNYSELGNNQIEIITNGGYDPEYSLDGINYTDNNWFTGLTGGFYTVYVRDRQGCGEDSQEVVLLDYPRYFTPNGDGVNDYWQIFGISNFPRSTTYIFDRYGKLLIDLPAESIGWDGLYNNALMPSSDYWFKVILDNGVIFKGHFALKR